MQEIIRLGNASTCGQCGMVYGVGGIFPTICACTHGYANGYIMETRRLGNIYGDDKGTGYAGNVWDSRGYCPTLNTMQGGAREPLVVETRICRMQGRDKTNPNHRGPANENYEQRLELREDGFSNTITTVQKDNLVIEQRKVQYLGDWVWEVGEELYEIKIRKLTPKECFRLMDFKDEDFDRAEKVNSNTQLYKQAGNSIVRQVLCDVFSQMYGKG